MTSKLRMVGFILLGGLLFCSRLFAQAEPEGFRLFTHAHALWDELPLGWLLLIGAFAIVLLPGVSFFLRHLQALSHRTTEGLFIKLKIKVPSLENPLSGYLRAVGPDSISLLSDYGFVKGTEFAVEELDSIPILRGRPGTFVVTSVRQDPNNGSFEVLAKPK